MWSIQPPWDHKATGRKMNASMLRMTVLWVRKTLGPCRQCWADELRTPICLSYQYLGGLSIAAKHFPKWCAVFSHLIKREEVKGPQLFNMLGEECARQLEGAGSALGNIPISEPGELPDTAIEWEPIMKKYDCNFRPTGWMVLIMEWAGHQTR